MKKVNMNFIPQNVAPIGAKQVAIFDSGGNLVATLPLGGLVHKHEGEKKYSFGALSDVHLPYAAQNASTDFQKALTYFNNVANVDFICISGDMSDTGSEAEWLDYKNHVDAYSPNTPVHMCTGNHDTAEDITYAYPIQYTGHPLWYSFTQGDDVFIFFGLRKWQGNDVFYDEALQWLYDTLEENKDKRCFVFQHEMRLDGCGNAHGLYGWDGLSGKNGQVFLSLMEHYKNVIWFHGHSHTPFKLQSVQPTPIANYDRLHGCHSVHIPSLAIPRYGNSDVIFDAEGYVVDVYENGIHLRGIDFIEEEFVPIASYWIDTTPVEIAQGTYTDSLGVIDTGRTGTIVVNSDKNYDIKLNQRYSSSGGGFVERLGTAAIKLEVEPNTNYRITYSSQNFIANHGYNMIYELDENMSNPTTLNGASSFYINQMPTGFTSSSDKKTITVEFTTTGTAKYILITLVVFEIDSNIPITDRDLDGAVLALENLSNSLVLPEGSELIMNQRYSYSGNGLVTDTNTPTMFTVIIPAMPNTDYVLKIKNSNIDITTASGSVVYGIDSSKMSAQYINGGVIPSMTTGITLSEDKKSADITFTTDGNVRYIALSLRALTSGTLKESDIVDYVIELEQSGNNTLPEEVLKYTNLVPISIDSDGSIYNNIGYKNQSYVSTDGTVKDNNGTVATGYIKTNSNVFYIYGAEFALETYSRLKIYDENFNTFSRQIIADYTDGYVTEDIGNGITKLTFDVGNSHTYVRFSLYGTGENLYIYTTDDEPIEGFSTDLLQSYDVKLNQRWSASSNAYVEGDGLIALAVPYSEIGGRTLRLIGFKNQSADGSAWYAYDSSGVSLGRIAVTGSGVVWDSSALIDNGDGTYDLPMSKELFVASNKPITTEPTTIYITMKVAKSSISSFDGCRILVSDIENNSIIYPTGSELYLNQQYSQSNGGFVDLNGYYSIIMPIKAQTKYKLSVSNIASLNTNGTTLYTLDVNKSNATTINGSKYVYTMTGVTFTNVENTSAEVVFTSDSNSSYAVFVSVLTGSITEDDLKGIVIALEEDNGN